ncbi:site-specific integrase [Fulvivirga lutimaris]|uniref:site-specific integrase n=1 Tax=Fulvivirga lutimaris TaxID=1819566 RepID=UPI0012BB66F0|nr:site-specific integrase [Fulvivirga lutimaris]MTI40008.1 site-specific integrase [Fulvivirga lutimaris]
MTHTFSLLFWLQTHKTSKKTGEIPVSLRITLDGKRAEISTGKKILPEKWNTNSGRARGNSEEARVFNRHLSSMEMKIEGIYNKLIEEEQYVSAQSLKEIYQGKNTKQHSLVELFSYHNEQIKAQLGQGYSPGTLERYETTLKHLKGFLKYHFKTDDYLLNALNYPFITEFEFYLKSVKSIGHNTTMKYLRNFKKIVLLALKNEWIDRDPFAKYQMSLKEVKRDYLTKDEIRTIYEKEISMERLGHVRDIFLFCCYTGLAYADVKKLTADNITKGLDGEQWIYVDRTKTGTSSNVPLLPVAEEIINKYKANPIVLNSGALLPVISNQKMNAYLKELATLCEIKKNLTFHIARHTFATTVTLSNGVPIESVSSMLGHKNLKTTQIYAKVVQEKVSQDMKKLKDILGNSDLTKAVNQ